MKNRSFAVRSLLLSLCACAALMPVVALAQTNATWDGGGGDNLWSTGANWVGDVAPTPSTSLFLTFPGSTRTSPFNDRADFANVAGITFAPGASGFRIEGNPIGFVNGSGQQVINQNAAATQDINAVFSLGSLQDSQINLNAGDLLISAANTYIDSNNAVTRFLTIAGTDSTRRTITYAGNLNKSFSGSDPDMIIQNNKRVLVTGSLTFGSGNDASVFINDGVLQFSGAGTMTGGSPAIGNTTGSANAALLLDTAGATFARQIEMRGGSSGQRILGGVNASGTVTYSGNFVATSSPSDYDLKATSGGAANFSGSRNVDAGLRVNRADADGTTYGGAVILSGPTSSNSWNAIYAGTLQFSDFNQLGSSHLEFDATTGDSGTLRYTGGSTTTTKTLFIDNPGITRAGIDVSQAGTTLTWNPGTSNLTQNLTKTGAGSLSFGGAITGGSVSVESGLLSLTAGNSYAGGSLVSQGTLMGGASTSFGSGSIVLGDGNTGTSSIVLVANSSGNTTIANAITVANLGTGLVSIGGTNTGNTSFNLWNGTLTLNRNVQVFGDTTPGSSGRTSLSGQITGSGGITVTQGRVTLQNTTNNFTGPVAVNSGATLQLDVGGGTNEVIPNSSAVTVNGSLNFASGGGTETIGSLAGSGTVSSVVGGNYSFVIGGSDSTTFSGVINNGSGTVSLTKSGTGALTLSGTSTYSGTTTISNGTLQVAGLLGGGNYGAAISNNASLAFSNSASQTLSGVISGSGTLTKAGPGTLTLSQANSYSGGTVVSQGALVGGASTSFGSGSIVLGDGNTGTNGIVLMADTAENTTIANAITVANLGTGLVSIGGTNTGSGRSNSWTGTLTLNRNVQVFNDTPHADGRTAFIGQITGSGGITVTQGRGRVTLQNTTNNFTGPVVVNSGATLQLDVANGINELIPNSSAVTVNGALNFASGGGTETIGSLAGSGTVSSVVGGTYSLVVGGSDSTTFSGVINNGSGVIGLTKSGAGTLTLSGTSSYSGGTIVSAGQLVGTTASLQGAITNNASVAFDQATTGNYASTMSGSGSLTKLGVGTVRITGSNGYSGGTTITNGTVEISAGGSAGGSAAGLGTGTVSIGSGAQLTYYLSTTGSHTISNAFSLSGGTLYSEDGNNTFSGRVTLASGASTISSRYQDTITLAGGLAGSGNVLLTQAGGLGDGPTYVLSGTGANTGTVRVSGSSNGRITKLQVANVNALQSATLDMAAGDVGTVEFTVPGTNTYALGGLQGARNLAFGGNSLSVGGNGQSTTYSGVLTGSGSLTKVGGGRLALTGANTFSGATNVDAGELALNGSITGSLSVASIASLSGTGTVGGNATIIGTHSPGNSPGAQTFNANLTYQAGAVVNWELIANTSGSAGVNYDQIIMPTGNLTFSGSTTLALSFNSAGSAVDWTNAFWNVNRSWTVYDLSGGLTSNLGNLVLGGSLLDSLGNSLSPTGRGYFTTALTGQDVVLNFTAVPEPSTWAMALAGLACGRWMLRRQKPAGGPRLSSLS